MSEHERIVVSVTSHAAERARERADAHVTDIVRTVRLALLNGRTSAERPAWLGPGDGGHRDARFAWNAARTVCYVMRAEPLAQAKRWKVITTLTPERDEVAA